MVGLELALKSKEGGGGRRLVSDQGKRSLEYREFHGCVLGKIISNRLTEGVAIRIYQKRVDD